MSMEFSYMFDRNPPYTFDKIIGKHIPTKKCSHNLTLKAKVNIIAKIKTQCPGEQ